ncbi:MAG: glucuronate isomerase, partial [Bacteroidia bacterium]|nr:glucuronate isomerase [Bacteroidia bacterium]
MEAGNLCTSDDLLADLEPHQSATRQCPFRVLPSLRGDTML